MSTYAKLVLNQKTKKAQVKSLMKIVQQILEEMLKKLAAADISNGLGQLIDEIQSIQEEMLPLLVSGKIAEVEEIVFTNAKERPGWVSARKGISRTIETRLGTVHYERRLYRHRKSGRYSYLSDRVLQIDPYERIERELGAKLCTLATNHSYAKSAKLGSCGRVSRQSVMNLTREIKEKPIEVKEVRSFVKEIHIQCDEDHVARQDGKRSSIVKLVTIHEPRRREGNRIYLPGRFSLTSTPLEKNEDFWLRVSSAVYERYGNRDDLSIYLHGDAASWIKAGLDWLPNSRFVLDKFHVLKLVRAVSGGDMTNFHDIWSALREDNYPLVRELSLAMSDMEYCSKGTAKAFISYVRSNRSGIRIWEEMGPDVSSSCSEGLVSHMLSARMSSRPMGWLDDGMEAISRLRIHSLNGGKITGDDLRTMQRPAPIGKSMDKKIKKNLQEYEHFPLPTEVFVHNNRGSSIYRMFEAIKSGGNKLWGIG